MEDDKVLSEYIDFLTIALNKELDNTIRKKKRKLSSPDFNSKISSKDNLCGVLRDIYLCSNNEEVKNLVLKGTIYSKTMVIRLTEYSKKYEGNSRKGFVTRLYLTGVEEGIEEILQRELEGEIKSIDTKNIGLYRETIFDIIRQIRSKGVSDQIESLLQRATLFSKRILLKIVEYRKKENIQNDQL